MDPALDRFDIIDTTVRMAWHAPCREWDSLNDVLAPRARLDDTSLSGGDQAICTAAFQATHVLATPLGEPTWTLGGHYRFELTRTSGGWRIAAVTMTADWAAGNQQIMTLAAAT